MFKKNYSIFLTTTKFDEYFVRVFRGIAENVYMYTKTFPKIVDSIVCYKSGKTRYIYEFQFSSNEADLHEMMIKNRYLAEGFDISKDNITVYERNAKH